MTFVVNRQWGTDFPCTTQPKILGYYSLNSDRKYSSDLSQLKYYVPLNERNVCLDLNEGYEKAVHKPPNTSNEEKINNMLHWILLNYELVKSDSTSDKWLRPDFICFRGLLTKLWCTPFERQSGWIICAAKFKGNIYLCAFETEKEKQQNLNMPERLKRCTSWGFKFEQYLLSGSLLERSDHSQPVNEAEEFDCTFAMTFGTHRLLYGAEMDGIENNGGLKEPVNWESIKFVELKTSRTIETRRQEIMFLRKILKWWCQSFLVGIKKIVCGFRDDRGIVRNLQEYKVSDLVKLSQAYWQPSTCMNFCDTFLHFVKGTVRENCNRTIYKFTWQPGQDISYKKIRVPSQYCFLPTWYTQEAQERQ